ncbi:MAG: hypothetical protein ACTHMA_16555 [Thermomicrobiales bacterium]
MKDLLLTAGRPARTWLITLDAFLGVTAMLGGFCLVTGWYAPPLAMLAGSIFASYLLPGLALVLVGGGSVLAAVLLARRAVLGVAASAATGAMLLVFEAVELVVVGFTWLLAFYVTVGLLILALAGRLWLIGDATAAACPRGTSA